MAAVDISGLIAIVAEKNTVIDSATSLIASLAQRLAAASAASGASPDPVLQAAVDALVSDLEAHGAPLAKAVAENTVAAV